MLSTFTVLFGILMISHALPGFIFVGYQNDYFAPEGILRSVVEEADRTRNILSNTLSLIEALESRNATLIQTPIIFTEDYSELVDPVGILKVIKDV